MERAIKSGNASLVVLATLASIAALYFLKPILIPIALALVLACVLSPVTSLLRRILPLSSTGAAVVLFLLTVMLGLYLSSLAAESLVQAANTIPSEIDRLVSRVSAKMADMIHDQPYLRGVLPEPGTIDRIGDTNIRLLINYFSYGLSDLTGWVAQGFMILILVLFILAESEMLSRKVLRFFTPARGNAGVMSRTLKDLTHQIRTFLLARTLINLGMGGVFAIALSFYGVKFAVTLGLVAALTNFVPYVGQLIGGALPAAVALAQFESMGDALIVASIYLGVVGVESYIVTPYILGRSLDLNGTMVLVACLFWGFLWGLVGLVLAMPITVCMKIVFQAVPELNRWAELMSQDWSMPEPEPEPEVEPAGESSRTAV